MTATCHRKTLNVTSPTAINPSTIHADAPPQATILAPKGPGLRRPHARPHPRVWVRHRVYAPRPVCVRHRFDLLQWAHCSPSVQLPVRPGPGGAARTIALAEKLPDECSALPSPLGSACLRRCDIRSSPCVRLPGLPIRRAPGTSGKAFWRHSQHRKSSRPPWADSHGP